MGQLASNTSDPCATLAGVELESVRLRLLAQALEHNVSCVTMDLSRRKLTDEDGVALAQCMKNNAYLKKLDLEGNNCGSATAAAVAEALKVNKTLRTLILDSNDLV